MLDRYIVHELVSPFLFAGALFTFFLVIDRIYELTELVVTKGVPFHLVAQLLVFMLPSFLCVAPEQFHVVGSLVKVNGRPGDRSARLSNEDRYVFNDRLDRATGRFDPVLQVRHALC